MKAWFFSDTHGMHAQLSVPSVDIAIFCGDEANSRDVAINANESRDFFEWYYGLKIKFKLFVPGNHSKAFERGMIIVPPSVVSLVDQCAATNKGHIIYGSPYTPSFGQSWAYMRSRAKMHDVWRAIPDDTTILVTHGPPAGVLDLARDAVGENRTVQVGCRSLWKRVCKLKPKIHAFGHIHEDGDYLNAGTRTVAGMNTLFINCAVAGHGKSSVVNHGVVVDI